MWLVPSAVQVSESNLCPKKSLARENLMAQEKRRFCANNFSHLLAARQGQQGAAAGGSDSVTCVHKHLCVFGSKEFLSTRQHICFSIAKERPKIDLNTSALLNDVTKLTKT